MSSTAVTRRSTKMVNLSSALKLESRENLSYPKAYFARDHLVLFHWLKLFEDVQHFELQIWGPIVGALYKSAVHQLNWWPRWALNFYATKLQWTKVNNEGDRLHQATQFKKLLRSKTQNSVRKVRKESARDYLANNAPNGCCDLILIYQIQSRVQFESIWNVGPHLRQIEFRLYFRIKSKTLLCHSKIGRFSKITLVHLQTCINKLSDLNALIQHCWLWITGQSRETGTPSQNGIHNSCNS